MKSDRSMRWACAAGIVLAALAAGGCGTGAGRHGRRVDWVRLHPRAPAQVKKAVLGRSLVEGMSAEAVLASWGSPDEETDLGAGDARWKYRKHQATNYGRRTIGYTLIFRGGVVVRILTEQCR